MRGEPIGRDDDDADTPSSGTPSVASIPQNRVVANAVARVMAGWNPNQAPKGHDTAYQQTAGPGPI